MFGVKRAWGECAGGLLGFQASCQPRQGMIITPVYPGMGAIKFFKMVLHALVGQRLMQRPRAKLDEVLVAAANVYPQTCQPLQSIGFTGGTVHRSEERRVGRECRCRWWRERGKNRVRRQRSREVAADV